MNSQDIDRFLHNVVLLAVLAGVLTAVGSLVTLPTRTSTGPQSLATVALVIPGR